MTRATRRLSAWLHPVTIVAAFLLGVTVLLGVPPIARAECTSGDAWPSFRAIAPSAERVVVGRVIGAGYKALGLLGFRLEVARVYRGPAVVTIDFAELRPPPPLYCPNSAFRPRVGDVVAIAIDGRLSGHARPVTTVAYIEGTPDLMFGVGIETLAIAELEAVLSLPATDTTAPRRDPDPPPGVLWTVFAVAMVAAGVSLVRSRARTGSTR